MPANLRNLQTFAQPHVRLTQLRYDLFGTMLPLHQRILSDPEAVGILSQDLD